MNSQEAQGLQEVFDVMTEKVPQLMSDLIRTIYSEEAGSQMGKAVGQFYKELVAAGVPAEEALKMSKDYLDTLKSFAMTNSNG